MFWYNMTRFHDEIQAKLMECYFGFKRGMTSREKDLELIACAVADLSHERLPSLSDFSGVISQLIW